MRLTLLLVLAATLGACSATFQVMAKDYESDLSLVAAAPLKFAGKTFKGTTFLFIDEGYYAFYPGPVVDQDELQKYDVVFLPGEGAEPLNTMRTLRTGDKVEISAILEPDEKCFRDYFCTPWTHPVFLKNLKIIAVQHR